MIEVSLPTSIELRLVDALRRAGTSEIGGVLMGEHVGHNSFRIVDISIQYRGGSFAAFIRNLASAFESLGIYFARTRHDYKKFNYLGEWHSHPSFEPRPSAPDETSMFEIVNDSRVGAEFAVLIVVKLAAQAETMEATATVFVPGHAPFPASLLRGSN